jgi:hypothetical protein
MINLGFLAWFLSVKCKADVFRGCQDLELRSISENLDQVLGKLGNIIFYIWCISLYSTLKKRLDSWISLLILIFLNPCPSGFETMDRETGKRVRQVLLLNRLESPQEQEHFLDNLSRNSIFRNLLGRLYPSNQESGARELMGLILAARTDSSGLLRYVSSKVTNPSYSRALPFIWLHLKDEEHLASRLRRLVQTLYEIANPGQKITDGEYALKEFDGHGFKAQIVYVLEALPRSKTQASLWLMAHVRMSTNIDRVDEIEVYFETHDDSGPILGGETRFTETGMIPEVNIQCRMTRQNAFSEKDPPLKV